MNTTLQLRRNPAAINHRQTVSTITPMQRLKVATHAQHLALEERLQVAHIGESLATYRSLLQHFYGFYGPMEEQLMRLAWPADLLGTASLPALDVAVRQKQQWLTADLYWLGETPASLAALPRCQALPVLSDVPQALGYLYVVEGATLGGQVIIRQLQRQLPLSASAGAQFYHSYGEAVGPMWQELSHFVNSFVPFNEVSYPGTEKRMLQTAYLVFQTLYQWLATWQPSTSKVAA